MPQTAKDSEAKLCEAALRLAGENGWSSLTLEAIAKAAKIPLPKARQVFANKNHIVPAIIRWIDRVAIKNLGKPDQRSTPRDRLFEAMMARFDVLQLHRKGVSAIADGLRREPALARLVLPAHRDSMRQMLALSGHSTSGCEQQLAIAGLLMIYYRTFWYWKKDSSRDMARTMAALDQGLRVAGKAAELLFRCR